VLLPGSWPQFSTKTAIAPPIVPYKRLTNDSSFLYPKLDESQSEIRLLDLALTGDGSPIYCNLASISINCNPQYAALSYEWGDAACTEEILVNGHSFQATVNLVAALRQFRKTLWATVTQDSSNAIRLWVDAICINQNDISERNFQVGLMRTIYSKVTVVLSWMGMDEDLALAITGLRGIVARSVLESLRSTGESHNVAWLQAINSLCKTHYNLSKTPFDGWHCTGNYIWDAMLRFVYHSYWKRIWILQELVVGSEVWLVARDESINLDGLRIFTSRIIDFNPNIIPRPREVDRPVWHFITSIHRVWEPVGRSIHMRMQNQCGTLRDMGLAVMIANRELYATDPRDQIFGMLGIADMGITPDYSQSTESVYIGFATRWLTTSNGVDDLRHAGCGIHKSQSQESALNLPSWFLNWHLLPGHFRNFYSSLYEVCGRYSHPAIVAGWTPHVMGVKLSPITVTSAILSGPRRKYEFCVEHIRAHTAVAAPWLYSVADTTLAMPRLEALFHPALHDRDPLHPGHPLTQNSATFVPVGLAFLYNLMHDTRAGSSRHLKDELETLLPPLGLELDARFGKLFAMNFSCRDINFDSWPDAATAISVSHMFEGGTPMDGRWLTKLAMDGDNYNKRFFETADGLLGVGPWGIQADGDDFVCVLAGCNLSVVLRKRVDDSC